MKRALLFTLPLLLLASLPNLYARSHQPLKTINQHNKLIRFNSAQFVDDDFSVIHGSSARLTRSEQAVWIRVNTTELTAGAYTGWWVIFNDPTLCIDGCSAEDLTNPDVRAATLFRGNTTGDLTGPYISQFLWLDTPFGAERVDRRMRTPLAGDDYMTDYDEWLAVQSGASPGPNRFDPTPRYIRNGRDLGEWVHVDVLFQAYFNALLILFKMGAPFDAGNPYNESRAQTGFGTLGNPYIASVLCAVARPALKAVWYQKWFVHRRLRPEAFAGRIHNHVTRAASYPIHQDILNSPVLGEVFDRYGSYLLPMAFHEGSPMHPAYGAGHATVAGACVTVLKALFDESFVIPAAVEASADGLSLISYDGPPLTVGGELNKLASNIAIGRNIAGVHWRSDATEPLKLGEELAIRYLREERDCFNEDFSGFSLTKFDGATITI